MRSLLIGAAAVLCLAAGLVITQEVARAEQPVVAASTCEQPAQAELTDGSEGRPAKSCGFDSDCSHGKCKNGQCGACGFDSDCKGWGKCSSGSCGSCGFDSDCKGFGKCTSGKCSESPY